MKFSKPVREIDPETQKRAAKWLRESFALDATVIFTMKGKDYKMEFNNWVAKEFLKDTGIDLVKTGFSREHMVDMGMLTKYVYWLLKSQQPEITEEQVDQMMTLRHQAYIIERVTTALSPFYPDVEDIEKQVKEERTPRGEMVIPMKPTPPPLRNTSER